MKKRFENDVMEELKNETKGTQRVYKLVEILEKDVNVGRQYVADVKNDVFKFLSFSNPQIESSIVKKMVESLNIEELQKVRKSFSQNRIRLQSFPQKNPNSNFEFKI